MKIPQTWYHGEILVEPHEIIEELKSCEFAFVGCDSKYYQEFVVYANAICFYGKHGVNYFWAKEKHRGASRDLFSRIWGEVERAVDIGNWLKDKLPHLQIEVHADINSNPKYASNLYNKAANGYITGCGFIYRCKPDAWAATSVADWYTR